MDRKQAATVLLKAMNDDGLIRGVTIDNLLDRDVDNEIIEACRVLNFSICANGSLYKNDHIGFLPALVEGLFAKRLEYKRKMIEAKQANEKEPSKELQNDISKYHNFQLATKIKLNSLYGAIANQYFRWFNNSMAEGITMTGQLTIRWIEKALNKYINKILKTENIDYVIAVDTDSNYINLSPLVKAAGVDESDIRKVIKFLDMVCQTKLSGVVAQAINELDDYLNVFDNKIKMERDIIANKGIWTAKKRYILNVWDSEGVEYSEPKLKMMGIEAIRSSTPEICRNKIKEALTIIMNKDEDALIEFISNFKREFIKLPMEEVAFPRSVNDLEKFVDNVTMYKIRTPIHARAAIVYNKLLSERGLTQKYRRIYNRDKLKFCYLKTPNPIRSDVIGVVDTLPKEFDLLPYIDYDQQFEKAFLSPIQTIVGHIGWKTERTATLEAFFGQ